jgi:hypothetical protein
VEFFFTGLLMQKLLLCVSSAATANVCAKELQHRLSTGSADLKFPKMIHNAHGIPSA